MWKNIRVRVDVAQRLKIQAAVLDMSVQDLVDAFLRSAVANQEKATDNLMPRGDKDG